MIDTDTLKKHNLKAVPFSCIGEGQTFNVEDDFFSHGLDISLTRRITQRRTVWADGFRGNLYQGRSGYETVYVPVWRVTG